MYLLFHLFSQSAATKQHFLYRHVIFVIGKHPPVALIAFAFHMNLLSSRAILTTGAKGRDRILRQHKKEVFYQRGEFIAILF